MNEWFECKISYEKEIEGGKSTKISENYLVDAVSFIEAETRLMDKMGSFINGEFKVETVKRDKVYELFRAKEGDIWFKCKLEFITLDETSGKEKKTKVSVYLQSTKIDDVVKQLNENMKDTMCDYDIISIIRTNILNVFNYED